MSSIFKNKKGLGRGLSSLIGDTKTVSKNNKISVSDLIRNRYQPRKTFDEESLEELTNSIKSRGIIPPIGGFDISSLLAFLLLNVIQGLITNLQYVSLGYS